MANMPKIKVQYNTQLFELRKIQLLNEKKMAIVQNLATQI